MLAMLAADFHDLHQQRFSYSNRGDPVDIVTLRLAAIGRLPRCEASPAPPMAGAPKPMRCRRIYGASGWAEVEVFDRSSLGGAINGPALIQEAYTTVYIAPGWRCAPGAQGDLIAARNPA
jgi:N-methylhydantoinase A